MIHIMRFASSRVTLAVLALVAASVLSTTAASAMSISFSWAGTRRCSGTPPAFNLSAVPKGTTKLAFKMIDRDKPDYPHGGGTITYTGNGNIPAGSFSYTGPCPPAGAVHTYEWTVQATDDSGKILATARAAQPFK